MRDVFLRAAFIIFVIAGISSCGSSKSPSPPTSASPTTTSAATTTVATTSAATTSIGATSLAGTVTDAVSGSAVASATVAVQGKSATTGADGRYSITGLTDGTSAVTSQHQGHRNFTQNTAVSGSTTLNIVMTPAGEAAGNGNWSGTWRNTTFGSTGNATLAMTIDTVAERFSGTFDLSGSVFGRGDPAPETFSGPYSTSGATLTGTSSFYGTVTATYTPGGTLSGSMVNPAPNISRVDFSGTVTATTMDVNYTVRFTDGSTAVGTVNLRK